MPSHIYLALVPGETAAIQADCWVVVDLFRATTTMATLFARGLQRLTVTSSIAGARDLAREQGALLFGEEGGLPPAGFDYGNSPVEASTLAIAGRSAVLATTNGTRAICAVAGQGTVITGALANLAAVAAVAETAERLAIVCAGNAAGATLSLEDLGAAGAIVTAVEARRPGAALSDAARLAAVAWHAGGAGLLRSSEHARALGRLGLEADVEFALRPDTSRAVPRVVTSGEGWAVLEA